VRHALFDRGRIGQRRRKVLRVESKVVEHRIVLVDAFLEFSEVRQFLEKFWVPRHDVTSDKVCRFEWLVADGASALFWVVDADVCLDETFVGGVAASGLGVSASDPADPCRADLLLPLLGSVLFQLDLVPREDDQLDLVIDIVRPSLLGPNVGLGIAVVSLAFDGATAVGTASLFIHVLHGDIRTNLFRVLGERTAQVPDALAVELFGVVSRCHAVIAPAARSIRFSRGLNLLAVLSLTYATRFGDKTTNDPTRF
jgi:hypothetical protein